jgi:hypothetical protein
MDVKSLILDILDKSTGFKGVELSKMVRERLNSFESIQPQLDELVIDRKVVEIRYQLNGILLSFYLPGHGKIQ